MRLARIFPAIGISLAAAGLSAGIDRSLENTHWRLVQIQSMDDSVIDAEEDLAVGLYFGPQGSVQVSTGCAGLRGSWTFRPPSGLTLDVQPDSGEALPAGAASAFARQLPWIRSGLARDDKLFLATMADGSIIELAPAEAEPVGALVLGKSLSAGSTEDLRELVLNRVFSEYAGDRGLRASEEEVDTFVAGFVRAMEADSAFEQESIADLSEQEQAELADLRRAMADSIITHWKIGRSLYREYGGRIIYQQLGPEPLDAYLRYLRSVQQSGELRICGARTDSDFWAYFTDEQRHSFMAPGSEDQKRAFELPPWAKYQSAAEPAP